MRDRLSRSRNTSRASYVRLLQIVGGWNAPEHEIPMVGQNLKSLFNGTPSSSRLSFQTSGHAVLSAQRIGMAAERTARRLLRSLKEWRRRSASLTRGICGIDTMAKLAGKRMLAVRAPRTFAAIEASFMAKVTFDRR